MASTAKLISYLTEYEEICSSLLNTVKSFRRLLAFSEGVYGKQFTKDLESYTQQGSLADGTWGLYNVNPDIEHCIFEIDVMFYSSGGGDRWIAKKDESTGGIVFVGKNGKAIPNTALTNELQCSTEFKDPKGLVPHIFKVFLGKSTQIDMCPLVCDKEGTSIKYNLMIVPVKVKGKTVFEIHLDNVAAGKFQEWPKDIPWLQTEGKWPSQIMRQDISRKCHVAAVAGLTGGRCSFSEVETELFSRISTFQRHAYILFKSMFYCYLRPISCAEHGGENDDAFFTSYLVKTTFLLMCEAHPPEDEVWQCVDSGVQLLLRALLKYFKQGYLPHFAQNHNLFEEKKQRHNYLECNIMQLAVKQLSEMVDNFEQYLPQQNHFIRLVKIISIMYRRFNSLLQLLQSAQIIHYTVKLSHKQSLVKAVCNINFLTKATLLLLALEKQYGPKNISELCNILL